MGLCSNLEVSPTSIRTGHNKCLIVDIVEFILKHKGEWAWKDCSAGDIQASLEYFVYTNGLIIVTEDQTLSAVATIELDQASCVIELDNIVAVSNKAFKAIAFIIASKLPGWHLRYTHKGKEYYYDHEKVVNLLEKLSYGIRKN